MKELFLEVSLPVSITKEDGHFVAYTPALDLSTSADSVEEVKKRFDEVVQIFFEELIEKGTLDDVLKELGWTKADKKWSPPVVVENDFEKVKIPISA